MQLDDVQVVQSMYYDDALQEYDEGMDLDEEEGDDTIHRSSQEAVHLGLRDEEPLDQALDEDASTVPAPPRDMSQPLDMKAHVNLQFSVRSGEAYDDGSLASSSSHGGHNVMRRLSSEAKSAVDKVKTTSMTEYIVRLVVPSSNTKNDTAGAFLAVYRLPRAYSKAGAPHGPLPHQRVPMQLTPSCQEEDEVFRRPISSLVDIRAKDLGRRDKVTFRYIPRDPTYLDRHVSRAVQAARRDRFEEGSAGDSAALQSSFTSNGSLPIRNLRSERQLAPVFRGDDLYEPPHTCFGSIGLILQFANDNEQQQQDITAAAPSPPAALPPRKTKSSLSTLFSGRKDNYNCLDIRFDVSLLRDEWWSVLKEFMAHKLLTVLRASDAAEVEAHVEQQKDSIAKVLSAKPKIDKFVDFFRSMDDGSMAEVKADGEVRLLDPSAPPEGGVIGVIFGPQKYKPRKLTVEELRTRGPDGISVVPAPEGKMETHLVVGPCNVRQRLRLVPTHAFPLRTLSVAADNDQWGNDFYLIRSDEVSVAKSLSNVNAKVTMMINVSHGERSPSIGSPGSTPPPSPKDNALSGVTPLGDGDRDGVSSASSSPPSHPAPTPHVSGTAIPTGSNGVNSNYTLPVAIQPQQQHQLPHLRIQLTTKSFVHRLKWLQWFEFILHKSTTYLSPSAPEDGGPSRTKQDLTSEDGQGYAALAATGSFAWSNLGSVNRASTSVRRTRSASSSSGRDATRLASVTEQEKLLSNKFSDSDNDEESEPKQPEVVGDKTLEGPFRSPMLMSAHSSLKHATSVSQLPEPLPNSVNTPSDVPPKEKTSSVRERQASLSWAPPPDNQREDATKDLHSTESGVPRSSSPPPSETQKKPLQRQSNVQSSTAQVPDTTKRDDPSPLRQIESSRGAAMSVAAPPAAAPPTAVSDDSQPVSIGRGVRRATSMILDSHHSPLKPPEPQEAPGQESSQGSATCNPLQQQQDSANHKHVDAASALKRRSTLPPSSAPSQPQRSLFNVIARREVAVATTTQAPAPAPAPVVHAIENIADSKEDEDVRPQAAVADVRTFDMDNIDCMWQCVTYCERVAVRVDEGGEGWRHCKLCVLQSPCSPPSPLTLCSPATCPSPLKQAFLDMGCVIGRDLCLCSDHLSRVRAVTRSRVRRSHHPPHGNGMENSVLDWVDHVLSAGLSATSAVEDFVVIELSIGQTHGAANGDDRGDNALVRSAVDCWLQHNSNCDGETWSSNWIANTVARSVVLRVPLEVQVAPSLLTKAYGGGGRTSLEVQTQESLRVVHDIAPLIA